MNMLMSDTFEVVKAITMKTDLRYNEEFYRENSYKKYHLKVR